MATSLRWDGAGAGERALLGLTDGSEVPLDPATLTIDEAGILRCQVRPNGVEARLATSAASALAEHIDRARSRACVWPAAAHPIAAPLNRPCYWVPCHNTRQVLLSRSTATRAWATRVPSFAEATGVTAQPKPVTMLLRHRNRTQARELILLVSCRMRISSRAPHAVDTKL